MKIVKIVDKTGRVTHASVETDGYRVIEGSIFGHKGYGIAVAIELLNGKMLEELIGIADGVGVPFTL